MSFKGSIWDKKRKDTFYVKVILAAILIFAGLNLTPGYRAAQARNREAVKQIFSTPRSEVNEPR